MQIGDWSTPMNLIAGLALAAFAVSPPAAKPTVPMMSYFWSTKDWMFLAMSADTALVAAFGVGSLLSAVQSARRCGLRRGIDAGTIMLPGDRQVEVDQAVLVSEQRDGESDRELRRVLAFHFVAELDDGLHHPPLAAFEDPLLLADVDRFCVQSEESARDLAKEGDSGREIVALGQPAPSAAE